MTALSSSSSSSLVVVVVVSSFSSSVRSLRCCPFIIVCGMIVDVTCHSHTDCVTVIVHFLHTDTVVRFLEKAKKGSQVTVRVNSVFSSLFLAVLRLPERSNLVWYCDTTGYYHHTVLDFLLVRGGITEKYVLMSAIVGVGEQTDDTIELERRLFWGMRWTLRWEGWLRLGTKGEKRQNFPV